MVLSELHVLVYLLGVLCSFPLLVRIVKDVGVLIRHCEAAVRLIEMAVIQGDVDEFEPEQSVVYNDMINEEL